MDNGLITSLQTFWSPLLRQPDGRIKFKGADACESRACSSAWHGSRTRSQERPFGAVEHHQPGEPMDNVCGKPETDGG